MQLESALIDTFQG